MIKPAKDYELQIAIESIWTKDEPENKFLYLNNNALRLFNDETKGHEFAIIGENNELIGFVRYLIRNNKAYNLEAINFNREQSNIFGLDLIRICKDVFEKYNLDNLNFSADKKHPMLEKYKRLVSHYNGNWQKDNDYVVFNITKQQYFNK